MNVLDLFSGTGGMSLGLGRAGMHTVKFCELSEFCRGELARQWPGVPIHDDVRTLSVPAGFADLVCGGFPCQDISTARAAEAPGLAGERSGLWFQMLRIVRECRPDWVLIENVARLRTLGADRVLSDLEEAGYTARPHVVGAVHAGAPHPRSRVWIVANSERVQLRQQSGRGRWPCGSEALQPSHDDAHAHRDGQSQLRVNDEVARRSRVQDVGFALWEREAGSIQSHAMADGLPDDLDAAIHALGNAVIPQLAERFGRAILRCMQ